MANTTETKILTTAGRNFLAQVNAEESPFKVDKLIFANIPNRADFPQPEDGVPTEYVVFEKAVERRGRLGPNVVIYSTTLTSAEGPFEFNWTGAYNEEHDVLLAIDHHTLTPKNENRPGIAGNTLVRSMSLEYKDIAEITNITVDASTWQYDSTQRLAKMDNDAAQAIIDQNGKDWFIADGFLVTPQSGSFKIQAGAGYVSGNRVSMEYNSSIQVLEKPAYIYLDAWREGTPTGQWETKYNFVVSADELDDYQDTATTPATPHFVCKIAQVMGDGSVSDLRPEGESASRDWVVKNTQYLVPSFTQAINLNIPSSAKSLKTLGYDQEGDGVSFEYFLSGTGTPGDTDNGGYFVDQSGRKWVLQFDDVIHIKAWGVNSTRMPEDNAARIRAALNFGGNGKHYDFGDKDYSFGEVLLEKTKATLRGSGTYDGELLIRHSAYLVTHDFDMDFDIHLSMKTEDNTKSAVKYHYCSKGKCVIDGDGYNVVHHAIHHSAELGPDWGQPVRRIKFGGAYRNVNHFIKGENSEDNNISFTMADITLIPSTEGTALISHVDIDTIDGFTCHSQVQFFPGHHIGNQTKKHNIILKKYTWANIADNKFFESGEEALLLIDGTRLILHDNQYAWPGQRKPCYAVVIDGLPIAGDYFSQSIIHDENVIRPSLGGVIIKAGSGRIKLHDVETHYPGRNERYYGTTPIPDGDKYGIEVEDGTIDVKTHDNYVRRGKFLLSGGIGQSNTHLKNIEDINGDGSGVVSETVPRVLTLDYSTNKVDVRRFSMVNIKQPTPTIIDDLENTDSESKLVIFRAYNGNTTFKNSSLLVLKGSKDVTVPDRGVITFLCMSDGSAVEQSRSFDAVLEA
ncbi:phage tail protein [Photobacterium sp. TY1-4]|uniref:phage tail protein n=1 Tax=Photobacterium sp. TY1-4 TaxID=2899122 RepID=UPI0021BE8223|nr:phage tail protein [Photobacterium sp. TY1-4]UXI00423.1 phage tail protein [Photobacterium sp. TY1-4]